jgi:excisionase family DNA binding protein
MTAKKTRASKARAAMHKDGFLSTTDTAMVLGLSQSTVWRWIEKGEVDSTQVGANRQYIHVKEAVRQYGLDAANIVGAGSAMLRAGIPRKHLVALGLTGLDAAEPASVAIEEDEDGNPLPSAV